MNAEEKEAAGGLTENELRALTALRTAAEGWPAEDASGVAWATVHLDNAAFGTKESFAGTLASLRKKGLYRPIDRFFGDVRVTAAAAAAADVEFKAFHEKSTSCS